MMQPSSSSASAKVLEPDLPGAFVHEDAGNDAGATSAAAGSDSAPAHKTNLKSGSPATASARQRNEDDPAAAPGARAEAQRPANGNETKRRRGPRENEAEQGEATDWRLQEDPAAAPGARAEAQRPANGNKNRRRGGPRENEADQGEATKRRLQDVFHALENTPWHIVYPSASLDHRSHTVVNSTVTPPPEPLEVPRTAPAVIVLCLLAYHRAAQRFVVELSEKTEEPPPLVVLLICEGRTDPEKILKVQRSFCVLGVSDTIVQRSTGTDLRLDVTMCVRRAMDLSVQVNADVSTRLLEHDNSRFWPCIPRVFPDFPRMDAACTTRPVAGARIGEHELREKIGEVGVSEIYLTTNTETISTGTMKVTPKTKLQDLQSIASMWGELRFLNMLKHPNIMVLEGSLHAKQHIYFIFEYSGRRSLHSYMRSLPGTSLAIAQTCMRQIADTVAYCHEAGVAHRDLKPASIMVMESEGGCKPIRIKIGDFGCAVNVATTCTDIAGSLPFVAPEVILGNNYQGAPVDMFACGVILLELLLGVGFMLRILQWETPPQANLLIARQICQLFNDRSTLEARVAAHLGLVERDLLALLFGLCDTSVQRRWTSRTAADCSWLVLRTASKPA